jgi:two-component system OmpR family response regulator
MNAGRRMKMTPRLSRPQVKANASILVVEDDPDMAMEILAGLKSQGYQPRHAASGTDALASMWAETPDLAIIDRTLPGLDGLSLIAKMQEEGFHLPILVVSALSSADERIRGLKAGGDDYLGKPFVMGELFARIEALLRRPTDVRETALTVGPLHIDLIERTAHRGARELDLLPREFKLLEFMMRRPGQVLPRSMLLEEVWNYRFVPESNLVNVHMGRLRHKVDLPGEIKLIHSVKNVGFILDEIA